MAFKYETFDIVEVAKECGIQFKNKNRNGIEYTALCPFCADTKYHLGINREKGQFNCFKCGTSGNSISLVAKLKGISNSEAYKLLKNRTELIIQPDIIQFQQKPEIPMRSLVDRHNVYYDFLNMLKLENKHRVNLEHRGLSFAQMNRFMYRSIPTDAVFRREVLERLSVKHKLFGIPGFYSDKRRNAEMYVNKHGGMFVPVCNHEGYIQGLQMRLDVPEGSDEKKFRWFSSKHFYNGTGAKPWIHVIGDTTAKKACLVEGPMKADITSVLSNGQLFVAVPGVNAIEYLPEVIRTLGIDEIYEAFDMDKKSNEQVKKALIRFRSIMNDIGVRCRGCNWNPKYKGIDDYFYAKTFNVQPQPQLMAA